MRSLLWCVVVLGASCFPSMVADGQVPLPVTEEEHAATVRALRPPKRSRPIIAVVSAASGAETTDFLIPFGVLRRSGVAEVFAASSRTGRLSLHPALSVTADKSFSELEALAPDGVDYVIVPAMHDPADADVLAWVRAQHDQGAIIVGICSGVRVLGYAGLLEERRATGHWADLVELQRLHPTMQWVRDRRYVVDRSVATTTGVSASIPISLALIEAIAGAAIAREVADELGVSRWTEEHDSDAFHFSDAALWSVVGNELSPWSKQRVGINVADGVDEVALALAADAFSRTFVSRAEAVAPNARVVSRSGVVLDVATTPIGPHDYTLPAEPAGRQLDAALGEINRRYGSATAAFVATQEEYDWVAP